MRLWWITATALLVLVSFGCFFGITESVENGYVEAKDFRTGSKPSSSSSENKVTIRRRLIRRKLDSASGENEKENATVSMRVSTSQKGPEVSSEDSSLPKSTTFTQARRALFSRLNKPLLKNRSLDSTISKLRSRLGAVSPEATTPKPRYYKKVIKKVTTAKPESEYEKSDETSPISIQVPTDKPNYKGNDSMIMIPVPESQRKPYQPVIMQVSKPNESSTASPDAQVVTYKLNKMFVPMGIYGRVVQDSESNATSTSASQEVKGPEVRHKGTQSESSERNSGVKVSDGSDEKWEIKSKTKKTRKQKEHSSIADTIDITYNYRPKYDQISITTSKMDASQIAITTDKPMLDNSHFNPSAEQGNGNRRNSAWGPSSSNKKSSSNKMTMMSAPGPMRKESTSSNFGFLDTLKQTASNIPGLFHKGFTSLTSITNSYAENPFHDDTFASGSEIRQTVPKNPGIVGAIPGGYIPKNKKPIAPLSGASTQPDYETLEYFRNRPHLFGRQNRFKESKSISGFKPVTAPAHMAKEYFGTTPVRSSSTTPSPKQTDSYVAASEEILKASPSSWKVVSSENHSNGVPTEDLNSSWKDYLFQPKEYGTEPASSRTWRSMLGLGPAVEESSMMDPTYGNEFSMLDGGRRRSMMLDNQWKDITNKYTKHEIDEAKERIYEAFSGPQPRSDDDINIMRPPLSGRVGGAFEDLMKMFKLWFNVGHGKSFNPIKNFDHIKSESSQSTEDSWTPVSKAKGKPLISFSAGISFPTKSHSSNKPSHNSHGSHYSASPKPFIPNKFNKGGLSNHITTLAHNYAGPTKPSSLSDFGKDSHYISYSTEGDSSPYGGFSNEEVDPSSGEHDYTIGSETSQISKHASSFGSHYAKGSLKDATLNSDPLRESASTSFKTLSGNSYHQLSDADDSPYELVPSDVYFSQKNHNLGDIAAVVKPEGITDAELKAHLPSQISGVPTLNYPPEYHFNKNPQQTFSSLNHLQQYLTTSDGKPLNAAHNKKIAEKYKAKEQSFMLPQKFYDAQYAQAGLPNTNSYATKVNNVVHQRQPTAQTIQAKLNPQTYQQLQYQQLQSFYKPQPVQQPYIQYSEGQISGSQGHGQIIQQQTRLKTSGDSGLGFSDFELPSNIDPDIAALLKAELDKDDVPEEIRKEFQQAKKEEAEKQQKANLDGQTIQSFQQGSQVGQSTRRSDFISQQSHIPSFSQSTRPFTKPVTNFHQNNFHQFHQHQHQRPQQIQPRPSYHQFHFNRPNPNPIPFVPSNRRQSQVVSKFFAPIPISPTHITQTLRGRYQSPVPRYVVELAKKLQRDKDVQGIVRVSTKRGSGPPIEYLYPVRG